MHFLYRQTFVNFESLPIEIPPIITAQNLVIEILPANYPNWHRAGFLSQLFKSADLLNVRAANHSLLVGKQLLTFDSRAPYQLLWDAPNYFKKAQLSIWIMPLSFSENAAQNPNSVTVIQKAITTTASVIAAASTSRRGLTLYNTGNAAAYIGYSASITPSTIFSFIVPKGGTYEFLYPVETCDIYAITASGTASMEVTEKSIV